MLTASNSYMHKHYVRFDADVGLECIKHYYEQLPVNLDTLAHLIMQFVGMPLPIIKARITTRKLLDIPWVFNSWNDAFAYYRSTHFQEPNANHPVVPFIRGAIEAYIVNKSIIKQTIYARTQEFNLVSIEELIMTNKPKDTLPNSIESICKGTIEIGTKAYDAAIKDIQAEASAPVNETLDLAVDEPIAVLTENSIGEWVADVLALSSTKSLLINRIIDAAKEKELMGKPISSFMHLFANGMLTYSLANLRFAEDNFKKLKRAAQKFVAVNKSKQPKPPVTQPDNKEEITMSATTSNTQASLYQAITKEPVTAKSARELVNQLFIDSQKRVPKPHVLDRFMESIDVSAHEHWTSLVAFMAGKEYKPNLLRLPFGELILSKLQKHLNVLRKDGVFDFSGIPLVNEAVVDVDTSKLPELDTSKLNVNETTESAGDTEAAKPEADVMSAQDYYSRQLVGLSPVDIDKIPQRNLLEFDAQQNTEEEFKAALKEKAVSFNILRQAFQRIFKHDSSNQSFVNQLIDDIATFAVEIKVGNEPLYPIINDQNSSFTPVMHHDIFNSVMTLQLIAFYMLHEYEKFNNADSAEYKYSTMLYVDKVTRSLNEQTDNGKWFNNNHITMHLNIMPNFALVEGDKIRASYMIASGLVDTSRANQILTMSPASILTDLAQVPAEYFPLNSDQIRSDIVAIGILQTMIKIFTVEEKDVKTDKPALDTKSKHASPTNEFVLETIRIDNLRRLIETIFGMGDQTTVIVRQEVFKVFETIEHFKIVSAETGQAIDWHSKEISLNATPLMLQMIAVVLANIDKAANIDYTLVSVLINYVNMIVKSKVPTIYTAYVTLFPNLKAPTVTPNIDAFTIIATLTTPSLTGEILKAASDKVIPLFDHLEQPNGIQSVIKAFHPALIAVGIVQYLITQFTKEEKAVNNETTQFTIDASKPLSGKDASFVAQPAINPDDLTSPKTVSKVYIDIALQMFGAAVGQEKIKEVFGNMQGNFIQIMAKHIEELGFNTQALSTAQSRSWWAFLALETYFTYMIKHINEKHPVELLSGYLYVVNTFAQADIFKSEFLKPSLVNKDYNFGSMSGYDNILSFITSYMADDKNIANYRNWYNSVQPLMPISNLQTFSTELSKAFCTDNNYAVYILASTFGKICGLNVSEKPKVNNTNMLYVDTVLALVNNTDKALNQIIEAEFTNAVTKLGLPNNFVAVNNVLLTKVALTAALMSGKIAYTPGTSSVICAIYDLKGPTRTDNIEVVKLVFAYVSKITGYDVTYVNSQYNVNGIPLTAAVDVISRSMLTPAVLNLLATRDAVQSIARPIPFQYPNANDFGMRSNINAHMDARQPQLRQATFGSFGYPQQPTQGYLGPNPTYNPVPALAQQPQFGYPQHQPMYAQPSQNYDKGTSHNLDLDVVEELQELQSEIDKLETVKAITDEKLSELREALAELINNL